MPEQRGDQGGAGVGLLPRVTWCKSVWTCSPQNTAPCGARVVTLTDTKTTECVGFAASQPRNIPRVFAWGFQPLPWRHSPEMELRQTGQWNHGVPSKPSSSLLRPRAAQPPLGHATSSGKYNHSCWPISLLCSNFQHLDLVPSFRREQH